MTWWELGSQDNSVREPNLFYLQLLYQLLYTEIISVISKMSRKIYLCNNVRMEADTRINRNDAKTNLMTIKFVQNNLKYQFLSLSQKEFVTKKYILSETVNLNMRSLQFYILIGNWSHLKFQERLFRSQCVCVSHVRVHVCV